MERKKSKIKTVLICLLLLAGFGLLNYPTAAGLYNRLTEAEVVSDYASRTGVMSEAEASRLKKMATAYNERLRLSGAVISDAFTADTMVADDEYMSLLSPNDDRAMAMLEIPNIHVYAPIYHGTSTEVLKKGIGHLQQTSLPVGGPGTHAVVSGHRGLPSAVLFTDLDQMAEGDVFYIHVLNETLAYEVDQIKVVTPDDISDLAIAEGEDYVTLVTCTPYGINSHRLLVRAGRIPYTEDSHGPIKESREAVVRWLLSQKTLWLSGGLAMILLILILKKRRKR